MTLLLRSQKKVRSVVEKTSITLENGIPNCYDRQLAESWTVKALRVRAQDEMRNILLEIGGKEIFIIQ